MDETIKAWAAGFIDGEGAIMITRCRSKTYAHDGVGHQLNVHISNTHKESLNMFSNHWGGKVHTRTLRPENRQLVYEWRRCGKDALNILMDVYPYLYTKKEQAHLAMTYPMLSPGTKVTDEIFDIRDKLRLNIKGLNHGTQICNG